MKVSDKVILGLFNYCYCRFSAIYCRVIVVFLPCYCRLIVVLQALFGKIHLFPVIKNKKLYISHVTTWTPAAYRQVLIYAHFFFFINLGGVAYIQVCSVVGKLRYVNNVLFVFPPE